MLPKNKPLDLAIQSAVGFAMLILAIILIALLVHSYSREAAVVPEEEMLDNIAPVGKVLYRN